MTEALHQPDAPARVESHGCSYQGQPVVEVLVVRPVPLRVPYNVNSDIFSGASSVVLDSFLSAELPGTI